MINYSPESYIPYAYQTVCKGAEGHDLPINVYLPTVENANNKGYVPTDG